MKIVKNSNANVVYVNTSEGPVVSSIPLLTWVSSSKININAAIIIPIITKLLISYTGLPSFILEI